MILNTLTTNPQIAHPDPSEQFDAIHVHGVDAEARQIREFAQAQRHSGKVRFLKIALPVVAVLVILGIVGALVVQSLFNPSIGIGQISMKDGKLVMEKPELNGFDNKNRPYSLSADNASQNIENPARVSLEAISANLPLQDDVSASITAGTGLYDADEKTLVLGGNVQLTTSDGMQLDLEDANVDIDGGILKTENSVYAKSPEAEISSDGLLVEKSGKRIVFEKNVKMTINPSQLRKTDNAEN